MRSIIGRRRAPDKAGERGRDFARKTRLQTSRSLRILMKISSDIESLEAETKWLEG